MPTRCSEGEEVYNILKVTSHKVLPISSDNESQIWKVIKSLWLGQACVQPKGLGKIQNIDIGGIYCTKKNYLLESTTGKLSP